MLDEKDIAVTPATDAPRGPDGTLREDFVERVGAAVEAGDAALLRELVGDLHEADAGAVIEALDPDMRPRLIELMGADFDFTALTEVDDTVREEILEELPAATVAEGVRELDSDDAVAILEDLPKEEQAEILEQLPAVERVALKRSLDYPEDSAGRRMQDEFIAVGAGLDGRPDHRLHARDARSAGPVLGALRRRSGPPSQGRGGARPAAANQASGARSRDLFEEDLHPVRATDDQEEVARLFERYDLVSAPVVDDDGRLVGVITFDDIVDVIEEEAEEDIKALGGVQRRRGAVGLGLVHRQEPVSLAVRQPALRAGVGLGDQQFRGFDRQDGGARGADADRGEHGRQCRHADHDGDGACAGHPRAVERQCLADHPARTDGRRRSTGSALR